MQKTVEAKSSEEAVHSAASALNVASNAASSITSVLTSDAKAAVSAEAARFKRAIQEV